MTSAAPTVIARSQLAGANLPYTVEVGEASVSEWEAGALVAASAVLRPTSGKETGYFYRNGASAGQTGPSEPAWPTTGTVPDGSATWTPVAPPVAGGDTIASVAWMQSSPPDAALLITSESNDELTASAYIGGGTAGNSYLIVVSITMTSGAIYVVHIVLTVL